MFGVVACNNDSNVTKTTSTTQSEVGTATASPSPTNNNTTEGANSTNARLPLTPQDSTFVMKAAMGGMLEVEAGKIAQQNAQHERVKTYGAMMVKDHSGANQELISIASGRGMTIPTALPADMKKMTDAMRTMRGRAFDAHYMGMMVKDHQQTVAEFQRQASSGGDPELKAWAGKTLPVLQMHRDSATAINNTIK